MSTKPFVVLKDVAKRWNGQLGVENISLEVEEGSFVALLGPSGCGRSTSLRLLAGLEIPDEGKVFIDGADVTTSAASDRNLSMVFQSYALFPHLSVAENVIFGLKVRKVPKAERNEKMARALSITGLEGLEGRKPGELSGGQRQRVALARAIVREPNVFLMDEPLSNLDAKLRVSTRAQIKNLCHELAVTTIYVTHDQVEAMTLADRVVVMEKGFVQQIGSPTEIYDKPANTFVAGFIGSPAMNLISGETKNGVFTAPFTKIKGLKVPDGPLTLGFRAEDAAIVTSGGEMTGPIYTLELLGDATMVSIKIGSSLVSVKTDKNYRAEIDDNVSFNIPLNCCHLFNASNGRRVEK